MRYVLATILALVGSAAYGACPDPLPDNTVCLTWQAPTENVDGSPLTDLAGYNVYYGSESRTYEDPIPIESATATDATLFSGEVSIVSPGPQGGDVEVYFAMTALDEEGNESAFSNEVLKTVNFPDALPPGVPTVLEVLINVSVQ